MYGVRSVKAGVPGPIAGNRATAPAIDRTGTRQRRHGAGWERVHPNTRGGGRRATTGRDHLRSPGHSPPQPGACAVAGQCASQREAGRLARPGGRCHADRKRAVRPAWGQHQGRRDRVPASHGQRPCLLPCRAEHEGGDPSSDGRQRFRAHPGLLPLHGPHLPAANAVRCRGRFRVRVAGRLAQDHGRGGAAPLTRPPTPARPPRPGRPGSASQRGAGGGGRLRRLIPQLGW